MNSGECEDVVGFMRSAWWLMRLDEERDVVQTRENCRRLIRIGEGLSAVEGAEND
jgi:hypothetical protein